MSSPYAFITPANRGIGYALTRHILRTTTVPVIATARRDVSGTKNSLLRDLEDVDPDRLTVLELDVLDEETITAAASKAKSLFPTKTHHLRLNFSVPGLLFPEKSPSQINEENVLLTFRTNTIGPMLLLKHFSPFLPRKAHNLKPEQGLPNSAVYATMSARVGSTTDNTLGGWYSYRASKSAVNSITKTFDQFLRTSSGENAMAIALHPGTVKTEFTRDYWSGIKEGKLFTPEYSAEKLVGVVNGLSVEEGRGRCWDWAGKEIAP